MLLTERTISLCRYIFTCTFRQAPNEWLDALLELETVAASSARLSAQVETFSERLSADIDTFADSLSTKLEEQRKLTLWLLAVLTMFAIIAAVQGAYVAGSSKKS